MKDIVYKGANERALIKAVAVNLGVTDSTFTNITQPDDANVGRIFEVKLVDSGNAAE